jgi:methyl-accepting chemotaxis protein
MTTEERFQRIEHITALLAEERRKDRDEYKALWRDSQREMAELRRHVEELAVETRLRFDQVADRLDQVGQRIDQLAEQTNLRINQLGDRIESLVSAIGQLIGKK